MPFIGENGGIDVRKTRKSRFFIDISLIKWKIWAILTTLMACGMFCAYGTENQSDAGNSSGATVTNRPNDAERLRELNRLRDEADLLAERAKRLELEKEALENETARLRKRLNELRENFQAENESCRQLRLWLAGVPAEGTVRKDGKREDQLLNVLAAVLNDGGGLALKSIGFCDRMRTFLREVPIGEVRKAELQLELDALSRDARRFIAMTNASDEVSGFDALRTCRILALDRELGIAILSVGSGKGAFPGMLYKSGKDLTVQLRLVGVRPTVAAAVPIKGSIEDLTPGMEAVAGEEKGTGE